jgi:hypothetical protein
MTSTVFSIATFAWKLIPFTMRVLAWLKNSELDFGGAEIAERSSSG